VGCSGSMALQSPSSKLLKLQALATGTGLVLSIYISIWPC
jgi:hypothetical protein